MSESRFRKLALSFAALVGVISWLWTSYGSTESKDFAICDEPPYKVRILSYDPFMMHIENFLSQREIEHLLKKGSSLYKRSGVNSETGISPGRTSSTATLPLEDGAAHCISLRAAEIQGFLSISSIEKLQMTRYHIHEQYRIHYDWSLSGTRTNERISTFFAILQADCVNCGTQFPELMVNTTAHDDRWCDFVECGENGEDLVPLTVKAKAGNAFYWRNLLEDGRGDERTLHAGLPVEEGMKVGLNIWTRQNTIDR